MKTPRYTDSTKFRLPYVRATFSRAPGYLRRRFEQYVPGWKKVSVDEKQTQLAGG